MHTAKPFEKRKTRERKLPQLTRVIQTRVFSVDPLPTAVFSKSGAILSRWPLRGGSARKEYIFLALGIENGRVFMS